MSTPETTRIMRTIPDSVDDLQDVAEINQELLVCLRQVLTAFEELDDSTGLSKCPFDQVMIRRANAAIARANKAQS